jgi:electron transport complex protein RnfG
MAETPRQSGYINQAWLVIFLALIYGAALAGVQSTLSAKIDANKKAETYRVIPTLVPGAEASATKELTIAGANGKERLVYQALSAAGQQVGWVLPATGQGFADRIDLLVGLTPDVSTITGIYVLDQKETPGLGSNITTEGFRAQFQNLPAGQPVLVTKAEPSQPNEVRALAGATISSESVAKIVNDAVADVREPLQRLPKG